MCAFLDLIWAHTDMHTLRALTVSLLLICWMGEGHCRRGAPPAGISPKQEEEIGPWFTGPLLTSSARVVPAGYFNFEPYLFAENFYGVYDENWHPDSVSRTQLVNPLVSFIVGVTPDMDIAVAPQFFYQRSEGKSATRFGDFSVAIDYQLLWDDAHKWWPAIKLIARELFPTGKYQHFDPDKNWTDDAGAGAFETDLSIVFGRLFHLKGNHYLSTRLSFTYAIPSNVHVEGFNNYGGGFGTNGTVKIANNASALLGMELNVSQNWVLALDIATAWGGKISFSGKRGVNKDGTPATVGGGSFSQISLAPALEYNFSENVGIILGCWFSVAGRNSSEFASGVLAVNWYSPFKHSK